MRLPRLPPWAIPVGAGAGAGLLGAVVVWWRSSAARSALGPGSAGPAAAPPPGAPPAPGPIVAMVHTGKGSTWAADRYAALSRAGISSGQARAIVALWALESVAGVNEYNFNLGNYSAPKGISACYYAKPHLATVANGKCTDQYGNTCPVWWIAYPTLDAGVTDWIARTSRTWSSAWAQMQSNPSDGATWLPLMHSYYGCDPTKSTYQKCVNDYVSAWQSRYAQFPNA